MIIKTRKLLSCLLCLIMLLSCLPATAFAAQRGDVQTTVLVEQVADISAYRAETKTAPVKDGYVFGGWYTDESCALPLSASTVSGMAYAKFVPAEVLTVKAQLTAGTTAQSEKTDLRLITTVDNLYYASIGFSMTVNEKTRDSASRTVYRALTAKDSGERIDLLPTAFSTASAYFHTCTVSNLPNAKFNDVIHVEPYWLTLDGTRVVGAARDISVNSGITPPETCTHEKCEVCGGCLEENCDCTIEGCCTPCTCTPALATYAISADGFYGTDGAWRVWTGSEYVVLADKGNAEAYRVDVDVTEQREGEGAMTIVSAAERDTNMMYLAYTPVNTGITRENGQLKLWLYLSDTSVLNSWNAVQISSGWLNENSLNWGLTTEMVQTGWNELTLNFADATETGTFDPASFNLFWFCVTGTPDGVTVKLDNIRIQGTAAQPAACTHEKCEVCGGCLEENCTCEIEGCCTPCTCNACTHTHCRLCGGCQEAGCDHTDACCTVKCPGEGNHDRDVAFTAPNVWCYWTPEGYEHLENGVDMSEEALGYMDGERKYLCSNSLTYVPNQSGTGGRLWSSFFSGDTNERVGNYLAMVTSEDNGETWSELSVVVEHPDEKVTCVDGTVWTDPNGRLWVFWTQEYCPVVWRNYDYDLDNHNLNPDGTLHADAVRGVWCMYSDNGYDANPTFSEPVRLCDGQIINQPTVAQTATGEEIWLITPYMCSVFAVDDPATSLTQGPTLYTLSLDANGVPEAEYYSKIMEEPYAEFSTFRNYCEPMTAQTSDGSLMMLVRTDKGIEVTRTTDPVTAAPYTGGWTTLDYLRDGDTIMSKTASRPNLTRLADGRLLLLFHDTLTSGRINLTIALSEDGGQTWPYKLLLDERAVSYPDLTVAPDGTIYVQYDFERYALQCMYLTRLTVADIIAGEFASEVAVQNLLINDNDYNKPAAYQKVKAVLEETAGAWFGTNATSDGYKKLGTAAAEGVISYADATATVPSTGTENPTGMAYLTTGTSYIDSGLTIANGAVAFELYVSDRTTFNQKWGIVSIGDNNSWIGDGMGNRLTWNMRNVIYQDGWNEVYLNFKDALSSGSAIDLTHIGGFWLYSNQVPEGVEMKVRNIRFIEGSAVPFCEHAKCPTCGGCLEETCTCTIEGCCTPCTCTNLYAISADYLQDSDGLWKVWTGEDYVELTEMGNTETYAVTLDTVNQKEGDGALQIIAEADRDTNLLYQPHSAKDLKMVKDSMQLTLWIYVSDNTCFDAWSRIQISSNQIGSDCLSWALNSSMLSNGWNELTLDFAAAEEIGTFDPAGFKLFWFCTTGGKDGDIIKLDDIRIEGAKASGGSEEDPTPTCEHTKCRLCGGCTEAECNHADGCCDILCPGEGNHAIDAVFTAPDVYLYWTPEGYNQLENGVDSSTSALGYMDGERRFTLSNGLTYVPDPNGSGGRLWSNFVSGDVDENGAGNYMAIVTSGDDADTWTELSVVVDHPDEHIGIGDSTLWTDPDGRLWVFWTQEYCSVPWRNYHYDTDPDNLNPDGTLYSDGVRGVWCMYSENAWSETPTFSAPVRLCDGTIVNSPTVTTIGGEEVWLITPYICSWIAADSPATSDTQGPTLYTLSLGEDGVPTAEFYSHVMENPYEKLDTFYNFCEPITTQLADGSLMMLIRSYKGLLAVRTLDPLTTAPYTGRWTELDFLRDGGEILSKTSSRAHLRTLEDGTLLLLFHDTADASRTKMTAALSYDNGETWTDRLLLDARSVSYPDLTVSEDGWIYVQYDYARYGEKLMLLSKFKQEDIVAGAMQSEGSYSNKLINANDYNKPFAEHNEGVLMEDTTGDWFGTNSTAGGYKKYGDADAGSFTDYTDGAFSVTSDGTAAPTGLFYKTTGTSFVNSGISLENGALLLDLYVTDLSTIVYQYGIVSIGDGNTWVGDGMGNRLTWDLRNVVYQNGWQTVCLRLKDATYGNGTAVDLNHADEVPILLNQIGTFWLYSTQVPAGVEIKVKNVRFIEGSDTQPPAVVTRPEDDERTVALTPATVYLRSTTQGEQKITQGLDKSGRGYLSQGRDFVVTSNVEAIQDGENTVLWLSTASGGTDESRYNYAVFFASFDNGQTWQEQAVVEHENLNVQIINPRMWLAKDGNLYLGWAQNFTRAEAISGGEVLNGYDGLQGCWAVRIENPTSAVDMSAGTPVRISDGDGTNPPATITLDGKETLLFSNYLSPYTTLANETAYAQYEGIGLFYFDETADAYKYLSSVTPDAGADVDFYEARALQTSDGYLYLYYRSTAGLKYIKSTAPVTSVEQSISWSEAAFVPGTNGTEQLSTVNSKPNATTVKDSSGTEYILLLYHNNTVNNARNHLTAALSSDGGATWPYTLELDPKYAVSYPGLKVMQDGRIFISYDYRRYDAQALFLSCITVEDIIAGALVTEGSYLNKTVIHNNHVPLEGEYRNAFALATNTGWVSANGQTKHWVINLPTAEGTYGYKKYDTGAEGTFGEGKNVSFNQTENALVLKGNGNAAGVGALLFERSAETYYDLSGVTLENGALKLDIYVEDLNDVVTSGWGAIALSNGTWTGTGAATISWRPQDYLYTDGWNTIWLPFDKATVGASFNLSTVRTFWFAINGVAETDFLKLANISIVSTDVCKHEKCEVCGGCLEETCDCAIEGCCTPCTCPVITYQTVYTFPMPASNTTSWVTGGRWCAATNKSATWQSANLVKDSAGNLLTNAADGTMTVTAGQDVVAGNTTVTGLLFLAGTDAGLDSGVTQANGRLTLDLYVYDVEGFKANGSTLQIADINYTTARWINQGNRLTWDLTALDLVQGWNTLSLKLSDATFTQTTSTTKSTTFDPAAMMYLWVYTDSMPDGQQLALRNVTFEKATCEHEKCEVCGGCLVAECTHTIGCCTPCTCPVITYQTTYTVPMPASNTTSWVTGGRWCAATNKSKTWQSANLVKDSADNLLTNAADGTITITAGQDAVAGTTTVTGLLFLASSDAGFNSGITQANGRVTLDLYVYDVEGFKANGSTLQIADINYNTARWINQGNRLTWNLTALDLVQGWNTISLKLSDATFTQTTSTTKSTTFDPSAMMYLWVCTDSMPDGQQLALKNIKFEEGSVAE